MPDPAVDTLIARLSVSQLRQAKLARDLHRSLALQEAFPGAFEGPGKVTSCVTSSYRLRVTTASGDVVEASLFDLPDILWPEAFRTSYAALSPLGQTRARRKAALA